MMNISQVVAYVGPVNHQVPSILSAVQPVWNYKTDWLTGGSAFGFYTVDDKMGIHAFAVQLKAPRVFVLHGLFRKHDTNTMRWNRTWDRIGGTFSHQFIDSALVLAVVPVSMSGLLSRNFDKHQPFEDGFAMVVKGARATVQLVDRKTAEQSSDGCVREVTERLLELV